MCRTDRVVFQDKEYTIEIGEVALQCPLLWIPSCRQRGLGQHPLDKTHTHTVVWVSPGKHRWTQLALGGTTSWNTCE